MSRTVVHRGRKIEVVLDVTEAPDGSEIRRDMVIHPGAVAILPIIDADHICLLRNFRFILEETIWEIPAGTLEPNEPPEQAAVRELAEETGYTAGWWRKLGQVVPSPGCLSEVIHLYVAGDLTPGPMNLEPDEELQPKTVPWSDARTWALDGTIKDLKSIAAILMWERLRTSAT